MPFCGAKQQKWDATSAGALTAAIQTSIIIPAETGTAQTARP
jgi:hypothetical protein